MPLPAIPLVLAAVGLVAWGSEVRARRAYAATLLPAERRQFRAYCRVNPSWRAFMTLKLAERDPSTSPPSGAAVK